MPDSLDYEHVRRLVREFDAKHRDSQNIRRRIDEIRNRHHEWPTNGRVSGPIAPLPNSSESESETSS
jgi:hypothetical protein